ncbi:MAG: flagellar assembly protein FliH [Gammaproteobacteria bacterium]|nr:flagellar assembly protein FliH [Gammaproteobacteria bacterium]
MSNSSGFEKGFEKDLNKELNKELNKGFEKGPSKVISGESQTAYERWQAPNVISRQQQRQEQAGMVTARQLEDLQKQAYEEGLQLGKDEGYKAAFQQGLEEGRQQGVQDGHNEVALVVKRFAQVMQFLAQPLEQVNQSVEEELLALSMATAKQIIRREININRGQIVAVIKEAISALPSGAKKIKVYLHPADAEIVRENLQLSSESPAASDNEHSEELWSVVEEPLLTRGGCRIETEASLIDATIETRLAEIAARILGSERSDSERTSDRAAEKQYSPEPDNSPELDNSDPGEDVK